ncbi:hypothetical protein ACSQ67_023834 [Phaseolus vulgaris]
MYHRYCALLERFSPLFRRSSAPFFPQSFLGFPISLMAPDPNRAGTSGSSSAAKDDAVTMKKVDNEDLSFEELALKQQRGEGSRCRPGIAEENAGSER